MATGLSEHGLHTLRAQLAISMMVNIKRMGGRGQARINALNENGVTMVSYGLLWSILPLFQTKTYN